jgi:chromosomal replication initiator protein
MEMKDVYALYDFCHVQEVSVKDVLSKSRKRHIVAVRQAFIVYLRRHKDYTLKKIGQILDRDHTTIIHAIKLEDIIFEENPKLKKAYESACLRY